MKVSGLVAWTAIPGFLSAVCGDVVGKTRGACCVPGLCPEHSHVVGFRPNSDIAPRGAEGGRQCSPATRPMTRCSSVCRTLRARGWTGCKSSVRQMTRCGGPGIGKHKGLSSSASWICNRISHRNQSPALATVRDAAVYPGPTLWERERDQR